MKPKAEDFKGLLKMPSTKQATKMTAHPMGIPLCRGIEPGAGRNRIIRHNIVRLKNGEGGNEWLLKNI
jgi:hypothetical protein